VQYWNNIFQVILCIPILSRYLCIAEKKLILLWIEIYFSEANHSRCNISQKRNFLLTYFVFAICGKIYQAKLYILTQFACLILWAWKWRKYVPPKRRQHSTKLHILEDSTFQFLCRSPTPNYMDFIQHTIHEERQMVMEEVASKGKSSDLYSGNALFTFRATTPTNLKYLIDIKSSSRKMQGQCLMLDHDRSHPPCFNSWFNVSQ
jgi:hypothetical protein